MNEMIDEGLELDTLPATKDKPSRPKGALPAAHGSGEPAFEPPFLPIQLLSVSGRYELGRARYPFQTVVEDELEQENGHGAARPISIPHPLLRRGTLNLDVDGSYPQNTASGTLQVGLAVRVHWIARLRRAGNFHWTGQIWFKDGPVAAFPYTTVDVKVTSGFPTLRRATVRFAGAGPSEAAYTFTYRSRSFHAVEFEFDCTPDAQPVLAIDRHAHPNRPPTLPSGNLSIQDVFARAGFAVSTSAAGVLTPKTLAEADGKWSDMELHDAMQAYWSRFSNNAQWAMWVFFAAQHEQGSSLGGIMFDDIGPNHRQGTAIFTDSFIKNAPPGDPAAAAWVKRMVFWTACHEMGHSFNLAHSWQKSLGTPWIPLANEPGARSFMNYPHGFAGGQTAFFSDFQFRFSDSELLFMRHAPERFVQMGNADWFDHHGFQQAEVSAEPAFQLELRSNRSAGRLQYLEPAVVDVVLTNVSGQPKLVGARVLADMSGLTVLVKREGRPAREYKPYATYCSDPSQRVMLPSEALTESIFLGADRDAPREGWLLGEPGKFTVQALLRIGEEEIVSAPLHLRVDVAGGQEELRIAQDFFSDEVGRVLFFDGSHLFAAANDTLRELIAKLPASCAAIHSAVALARAASDERKVLDVRAAPREPSSAAEAKARVTKVKAQPAEARRYFKQALESKPDVAAQSLGRSDYLFYVERYLETLGEEDRKQARHLRELALQGQRDGESRRPPRPR